MKRMTLNGDSTTFWPVLVFRRMFFDPLTPSKHRFRQSNPPQANHRLQFYRHLGHLKARSGLFVVFLRLFLSGLWQLISSCWGTNVIWVYWCQGCFWPARVFRCLDGWFVFRFHINMRIWGFPSRIMDCSEVISDIYFTYEWFNVVADGCKWEFIDSTATHL